MTVQIDDSGYYCLSVWGIDPDYLPLAGTYSFSIGEGGCCVPPIRGNVDNDTGDLIDISDLVYLVDFMFNGGPAPVCEDEADIDGSGGPSPIDIADLVYLVDYMFNEGPEPVACP